MSYFTIFALAGAAPGLLFNLFNMLRQYLAYRGVRKIDPSWKGNLTTNISSQYKFIVNPESYINPGDSDDLKNKKMDLIKRQARYAKLNILGAALMVLGGLCGGILAALNGFA